MSLIERIHAGHVSPRRTRVLCRHFAPLFPQGAHVLDVGCGDGSLAALLVRERPDITLRGVDVLVRGRTHIPVQEFDGRVIPYGDASFDAVVFVDTLHHAEEPMALLREAVRVARQAIMIKDHLCEGVFARPTLRFMDQVGNARYGVALPCTYWPKRRWLEAFESLGLTIDEWRPKLGLYPWPANWVFERSLHFIVRLDVVR
jgi:SAM-dependent methyltransferase